MVARWNAAPVSFPGEGWSWGCPSQIMTLGLMSSLPQCGVCVCSPESTEMCSIPACRVPALGSMGGGPCLRHHPAMPPTHHGAYTPGCPSHPCGGSLPLAAAAAVPGNLSLKSINFSHTPHERCKNPSLLPPWLLSATIWHGPPGAPPPRACPAFDSSQTAGAL